MKRLAQLLLTACALALGAQAARAQDAGLKPPAKRKFNYTGKIVTNYDPAKDRTMVLIQLMPVKEGEDPAFDPDLRQRESLGQAPGRIPERLQFSMYFTYPGQTLATPPYVSVGFVYVALDPKRYESHELSAKVDGEKIELGRMQVVADKSIAVVGGYRPYTQRVLDMTIPYEQFLRIANAKRVKMRLGELDFDLTKDHLEAIRDLASRTAP